MMEIEKFFEWGTWVKFAILFIPLTIFVFSFAPTLKWKILLTFGAFIGVGTALGGSSLRKRQ